jgi:hypothetical protein
LQGEDGALNYWIVEHSDGSCKRSKNVEGMDGEHQLVDLSECLQKDPWEQTLLDLMGLSAKALALDDLQAIQLSLEHPRQQADLVVQLPMQKYLDG